jgi:hypothetical protein
VLIGGDEGGDGSGVGLVTILQVFILEENKYIKFKHKNYKKEKNLKSEDIPYKSANDFTHGGNGIHGIIEGGVLDGDPQGDGPHPAQDQVHYDGTVVHPGSPVH